ncbi:MAG: hypothetical protein JNK78_10915 [Planctomycetes bacterium]|nr:hypothetical protein [Planctomycetota bacterium]
MTTNTAAKDWFCKWSPVVARFLAGAMLEMLKWWLEASPRPTAAAMDAEFHALAHRALA